MESWTQPLRAALLADSGSLSVPSHRACRKLHSVNEDLVLLGIFLDQKETSVLFLPLASVCYLKWQELLQFNMEFCFINRNRILRNHN